jgi:hypothetical protein
MKTTLREANMWAVRFYRWKHADGRLVVRRRSPGEGFVAEQWPEGFLIIDQTDKDLFPYDVGTEPGKYQMGCIHPDRAPDDRKWWELPTTMEQLRTDCRGAPLGFNESITYCDIQDKDRCIDWYGSWKITFDLEKYLRWYNSCISDGGVDYYIIHDEKGMQCDVEWPRKLTRLEEALGGTAPPPPPTPSPSPPSPPSPSPPQEDKVDYRPIISMAYRDILNRPRNSDGTYGDKGGLDHKNRKMNEGMTEAEMREEMLRSKEYAQKNPEK